MAFLNRKAMKMCAHVTLRFTSVTQLLSGGAITLMYPNGSSVTNASCKLKNQCTVTRVLRSLLSHDKIYNSHDCRLYTLTSLHFASCMVCILALGILHLRRLLDISKKLLGGLNIRLGEWQGYEWLPARLYKMSSAALCIAR